MVVDIRKKIKKGRFCNDFMYLSIFIQSLESIWPLCEKWKLWNNFYYGFVFPIFVAVVASNLLNVLGHSVKILGYRSYNTSDKSSNNPVMGYLGFGEGWHNNHHKFPGSARFGLKTYELDLGYLFIKMCEKLHLVSKIKTAK